MVNVNKKMNLFSPQVLSSIRSHIVTASKSGPANADDDISSSTPLAVEFTADILESLRSHIASAFAKTDEEEPTAVSTSTVPSTDDCDQGVGDALLDEDGSGIVKQEDGADAAAVTM